MSLNWPFLIRAHEGNLTSACPRVTRYARLVFDAARWRVTAPPDSWVRRRAKRRTIQDCLANHDHDRKAGRFTQEDPIGLAGGLNLYGFANGDPVNFSDPFGLCPQWLTGRPCSGAVDAGVGFVPGVSTGVDIATAVSGQNPLTGEDVGLWGRGIALAGVLTPVSGGQIRAAAKAIGEGHAFVKHVLVRGEFAGLGIRTTKQLGQLADDIMAKATGADVRQLSGGRTAYWDDATGTVVIHNPRAKDQGTIFRPAKGREYFDKDLR